MIKNIYSVIAIVIVVSAVFWMSQGDKDTKNIDMATTSPSLSPTSTPTPTPNIPQNTIKPTPDLILRETKSHQSWVELFEPINRHLLLDENCTSITPSQVVYSNNTQIMLDNILSAEPRILKIGSKEYSLKAHEWLFVTIGSTTLPAKLTMFCGSMELGQLGLE